MTRKCSLLEQFPVWSCDNTQVESGTLPRLNLGNISAIAGNTKLGQFPAIAGKKPCYSRDLSWLYISLLYLVMFPAIARSITRPPNTVLYILSQCISYYISRWDGSLVSPFGNQDLFTVQYIDIGHLLIHHNLQKIHSWVNCIAWLMEIVQFRVRPFFCISPSNTFYWIGKKMFFQMYFTVLLK